MLDKVEVLRAACCMAGLDGTIGEKELAILQKLATEAGVGGASLKAMMDRAKADPNYYEQQFRFVPSSDQLGSNSVWPYLRVFKKPPAGANALGRGIASHSGRGAVIP